MWKHMCPLIGFAFPIIFLLTKAEDFSTTHIIKDGGNNDWHWFPNEPKPDSTQHHKKLDMFKWINDTCDNGKFNLTMDWDFSPVKYSCFETSRIIPDANIPSELYSKVLPPVYRAAHLCMKEKIHYPEKIPMFGNHRPAWAKWGEYSYLPPQRWLHNLEHGAVVMLYHPCTHPAYVNALRNTVTGCLYRHIITTDDSLTKSHPMALVAWGHKLLVSYPSGKMVKEFIRKYSKKGAEETARQGYYDNLLINPAKIITDIDDKEVCPGRE